MKTIHFPYIALALASLLLVIVVKGGQTGADGTMLMPLLTLLVMSEFAFFVTAIGTYIGAKQIRTMGLTTNIRYTIATLLCLFLSFRFMLLGISLWPL